MGYAVYKLSKEDAAIFNKLTEKCWDGEKRDLSKLNKYERAVLQKLMDEAGLHEPQRKAKEHTFSNIIAKFNPYHDKLGRFTSPGGATSFTWRTKDSSKQGLANRAVEREKERTKNTFVSVISGKSYDMPELENDTAYAYREKALRHVEKYFSATKPSKEKYDEKMKRYLEETETKEWEKRSRATLSTISHSFVSAKTPSERKQDAEYKKDRESHSKAMDRAAMKRTPKYKEYESYRQSLVEKYTKDTWDKHGWYSKLTQAEKDKLAELQEATVFRNKRGQWQIAKSYEDPNVIDLEIVEKFNPYHDKLGRFTTANGATLFTWRTKDSSKQGLADKAIQRAKDAHANSASASAKQETDANRKPIRALEEKIKKQDFESAALFDKEGNQLFFKDGQSNFVKFTDEEGAQMKDGILTHNHPRNSPFSIEDVETFLDAELYEIRAVTTDRGVSVLRRTDAKDAMFDARLFKQEYEYLFTNAARRATQELDDKGYREKIENGDISEKQANNEHGEIMLNYLIKSTSRWAVHYGLEFEFEATQ